MKLKSTDLVCKSITFLQKNDAYLVLPLESSDPIVENYLNDEPANDYMLDVLSETTQGDDLIVDLGCHVGTFSVGAASLGRRVIAVDANSKQVHWVRAAALLNGFEHFTVTQKAISTNKEPIIFIESGLFGAIDFRRESGSTTSVDTARLDDIVDSLSGGRRVKFLKMDIEGAEYQALLTAENLLREHKPIIWFESNGPTLEAAGSSVRELRRFLEEREYKTFRVNDSDWIYSPPDQIQPEAWVDMIALSECDQARWQSRLRWEWSAEDILTCCKRWASFPHLITKQHLITEIENRESPPSIADELRQILADLKST